MNCIRVLSYARSGYSKRVAFRCHLRRVSLVSSESRKMTSSSTMQQNVRDPNTLSNYDEFRTIHTTANFTIDFEKKNLVGNILLKLKPVTGTERREVLLDTNHLDIHDVQVDGYSSKWDLLSASGLYGRALKISLDEGVERTGSFEINVSNWVFFAVDV